MTRSMAWTNRTTQAWSDSTKPRPINRPGATRRATAALLPRRAAPPYFARFAADARAAATSFFPIDRNAAMAGRYLARGRASPASQL